MKNVIYFVCISIGLCILESCTIESEMQLNQDFSGTHTSLIDGKSLVDLMAKMGGGPITMESYDEFLNSPLLADSVATMEAEMNEQFDGTGASNFRLSFAQDGQVKVVFDFGSLQALKQMESMTIGGADGGSPTTEMVSTTLGAIPAVEGKWVTLRISDHAGMKGFLKNFGGDMASEDQITESITQFQELAGGIMRLKMTYDFAQPIKKVKSAIPYEQVDNRLTVEMSIDDWIKLSNENDPGEIRIKLK